MISTEYIALLVNIIVVILTSQGIKIAPEQVNSFVVVAIQIITAILGLLKIKKTDNANWFGAIKR